MFLIQLSYVIMLFKNFMSYLLDVNLNKVDHGGDETKGSFAARYDIIVSSISFVQDLNKFQKNLLQLPVFEEILITGLVLGTEMVDNFLDMVKNRFPDIVTTKIRMTLLR